MPRTFAVTLIQVKYKDNNQLFRNTTNYLNTPWFAAWAFLAVSTIHSSFVRGAFRCAELVLRRDAPFPRAATLADRDGAVTSTQGGSNRAPAKKLDRKCPLMAAQLSEIFKELVANYYHFVKGGISEVGVGLAQSRAAWKLAATKLEVFTLQLTNLTLKPLKHLIGRRWRQHGRRCALKRGHKATELPCLFLYKN